MGNELAKALKRKTDAQFRVTSEDQAPGVVETPSGQVVVNDPSTYMVPYVAGKNINFGTSGANKVINAIMNLIAGDNITVSTPDENGAVIISSTGGGGATVYATSGVIDVGDSFSIFDTSSGNLEMILGDGRDGQELTLKLATGSNKVIVQPSNFHDGDILELTNPNDCAVLKFGGGKWHFISNFNAVISDVVEKIITIDSSKIDSDLMNYPVMVKFTGQLVLPSDPSAIYFTDMADNDLIFEREHYDATTQKAIYHVKIPAVSSTIDTQFKVKWDGTVDKENKAEVWDSNFMLVQHMDESLLDSTGRGNNGTNYGSTVVEGLNGKARNFDGVDDYVSNPVSTQLHSLSLLLYTPTAYDGSEKPYKMFARPFSNVASWFGFGSFSSNATLETISIYDGTNTMYTRNSVSIGWHCLELRYNGTSYDIYYDGAKQTMYISTGLAAIPLQNAGIDIGKRSSNYYPGIICEVRVSNIPRSEAWIRADDYNLRLNTLISM